MKREDAINQLAEALKARAEDRQQQAQHLLGKRGVATLNDHDYVEEATQALEESIVAIAFDNAMERLHGFGLRAPAVPPMPPPPSR